MTEAVPALVSHVDGPFACPLCTAPLQARSQAAAEPIACSGCGELFGCDDGIPLLFREHAAAAGDVTEKVKAFYEQTPFPDYEDLDSAVSLADKARQGLFARLLDEQIPDGARVLDAGCGTGQLSNFLALHPDRTVVGADLCLNSLRLAHAFKRRNHVDNVTFTQMNLFRPPFQPQSFHLVISNGVLHHTSDPYAGFQALSRLVRPGGFFILGLYNTYGRLPTDWRRLIFRLSHDRFRFLDPRWRNAGVGRRRKHSWLMDQYKHPHESKHTIGEVLGWLKACGFAFVNGIPKPTALTPFAADEQLFRTTPQGSALDHFIVQLGMLLGGGREGGLFILIGRKISS